MIPHTTVAARAASTGNLDLDGAETIDGVSCTAGHIVLAKDQTDPIENGVYTVAAGAWTRVHLKGWEIVTVSLGTIAAGKQFVLTNQTPVLGTDSLTFLEFANMGDPSAGFGPSEVKTVGTTVSIVFAVEPVPMTLKHEGFNSDASANSADTDYLYVMHASDTMAATWVNGTKRPLRPDQSWNVAGARFRPAYGFDHVFQVRASGNAAKFSCVMGTLQ